MIYIHPPLAIAGYFFIYLFTIFSFTTMKPENKALARLGLAAWLLTFLGLVTGMLWAQISWGGYWSWDPKETLTLVLFISTSASLVAFHERRKNLTRVLGVLSCIFVILTLLSSFIIAGLHSFA
jgi:ABC-type transport system involved in cytochrome c biogenesis permease subunit